MIRAWAALSATVAGLATFTLIQMWREYRAAGEARVVELLRRRGGL